MTINFRKLTLTAAATLLFAFTASAQVTGLEGTVKDESGNPIKDAVVKIERKDIKGMYPVKTDKKGHYGHYGLPIGTYKITLEVDGKVRDQVDNFRSKMGDPGHLDFNLKAERRQRRRTAQEGLPRRSQRS